MNGFYISFYGKDLIIYRDAGIDYRALSCVWGSVFFAGINVFVQDLCTIESLCVSLVLELVLCIAFLSSIMVTMAVTPLFFLIVSFSIIF